jgi:hypothetical protein
MNRYEQRSESHHRDVVPKISMSEDYFRWTLMWHGDFIRELTLLEVARDGLAQARQRREKHNRRRKAFVAQFLRREAARR